MTEPAAPQFQSVRNAAKTPADADWSKGVENVQKGIADALNARNVAFLLGAGPAQVLAHRAGRYSQLTGDLPGARPGAETHRQQLLDPPHGQPLCRHTS
jgi:hypothetical protein